VGTDARRPSSPVAMDGLRPFAAALLASLALAAPASADAPVAARWPAGGSTLRTALAIGAEHWGMTPCRGRVAISWARLGSATNAQSAWANDVDEHTQPSFNEDCSIVLSTDVEWDWPKLCTVMVHEVGHLDGHDHVDAADDVMYATYVTPVAECAVAPEPVETGPPPAAAPRTTTKKRAAAAERKRRTPAKRAKPAKRHR
jgi:hypothetical protein